MQTKQKIRIAGYQQWRDLTFLHWRVSAESLRPGIPNSLEIEEFDGTAWLGLVPFSMQRIRPWWSPAVPGISWFLETNLRTYVRSRSGESGVWFFSLVANSRVAVAVARTVWNLPYYFARLILERPDSPAAEAPAQRIVAYRGLSRRNPSAEYDIGIAVDRNETPAVALPGSLEEFLVERYTLFAQGRRQEPFSGRVHHPPYTFRTARVICCRETLTASIIGPTATRRPPDHVVFSDGVDVTVSPLTISGRSPTILEPLTKPPWPRCFESGRDARKSDEATHVVEER